MMFGKQLLKGPGGCFDLLRGAPEQAADHRQQVGAGLNQRSGIGQGNAADGRDGAAQVSGMGQHRPRRSGRLGFGCGPVEAPEGTAARPSKFPST